jgi:hypothetical protein
MSRRASGGYDGRAESYLVASVRGSSVEGYDWENGTYQVVGALAKARDCNLMDCVDCLFHLTEHGPSSQSSYYHVQSGLGW